MGASSCSSTIDDGGGGLQGVREQGFRLALDARKICRRTLNGSLYEPIAPCSNVRQVGMSSCVRPKMGRMSVPFQTLNALHARITSHEAANAMCMHGRRFRVFHFFHAHSFQGHHFPFLSEHYSHPDKAPGAAAYADGHTSSSRPGELTAAGKRGRCVAAGTSGLCC